MTYKSILVPGLIPVVSPDAMDLALAVARQAGEGRIEYLHVHPDARELARYTATLDMESGMFTQQVWDALVEGDKTCLARSRKAFETFCTRETLTASGAIAAVFRESEGNPGECTTAEARYADLVVLGRPPEPEDLTTGDAGDVLIGGGRPLLLAPSKPCALPLTTVAVAWKESAAAVHAIEAAMPLLKTATQIHVVGVAEDADDATDARATAERMAQTLARRGLKAAPKLVAAGTRGGCDALLEAATKELNAGLLVMGGYGHSRAREFVFGGFTRQVLRAAPLPVLLAH